MKLPEIPGGYKVGDRVKSRSAYTSTESGGYGSVAPGDVGKVLGLGPSDGAKGVYVWTIFREWPSELPF